jgi:hypothetical protein
MLFFKNIWETGLSLPPEVKYLLIFGHTHTHIHTHRYIVDFEILKFKITSYVQYLQEVLILHSAI